MKRGNILKVYIASKFRLLETDNKGIDLSKDFRTDMISDGIMFSRNSASFINHELEEFEYCGPFYCEKTHYNEFTSTDCNVVVEKEFKSIRNCDIFIAIFEEGASCGSCTELMYAISQGKKIIILYSEHESLYKIKNKNWFCIIAAQQLSNAKVIKIENNNFKEIVERELKLYV